MNKNKQLEQISSLIDMNGQPFLIETFMIHYLEKTHGKGFRVLFWVAKRLFDERWNTFKFECKAFWNIRVRGKTSNGFMANYVGMTEAEFTKDERE